MNEETARLFTLRLTPFEVDTLRGYLGEILATDSNEAIEAIYELLTEEEA